MQELEKHALSLYLSADVFVKTADPSSVLFLRPNHRTTVETFFSFYTNLKNSYSHAPVLLLCQQHHKDNWWHWWQKKWGDAEGMEHSEQLVKNETAFSAAMPLTGGATDASHAYIASIFKLISSSLRQKGTGQSKNISKSMWAKHSWQVLYVSVETTRDKKTEEMQRRPEWIILCIDLCLPAGSEKMWAVHGLANLSLLDTSWPTTWICYYLCTTEEEEHYLFITTVKRIV